jgi:hypothetical protein
MPGPLVEANEGDTLVCQFSTIFSLLFADAMHRAVNIYNALPSQTASIASALTLPIFPVHLSSYASLLALAWHASEWCVRKETASKAWLC